MTNPQVATCRAASDELCQAIGRLQGHLDNAEKAMATNPEAFDWLDRADLTSLRAQVEAAWAAFNAARG